MAGNTSHAVRVGKVRVHMPGNGRKRGRIDELAVMRAWMDWNTRSRREYLEALLLLPEAERRKDRGASWGSLQDIFLHVLEDHLWWFEHVISGRPAAADLVGRDVSESDLRRFLRRVDRDVKSVMNPLKPSDLGRYLTVQGIAGNGKPYKMTLTLADVVWHMLEEELQHRGEMNALFWQLDVDPPVRAWFSSMLSFAY